jgi:hypothetical protein
MVMRQTQRRDLPCLVQSHESRGAGSSLIFDVGKNKMKRLRMFILAVLGSVVSFAASATVGSRVTLSYDPKQWESSHPRAPAGDAFKIENEEGDFSVVVMPEKKISGGLSTAEARQKFIKGLSNVNAKTEDVKPIRVFEKDGYQFAGKREMDGVSVWFRLFLFIEQGEVIAIVTSSVNHDPLQKPGIEAVWKSVKIR